MPQDRQRGPALPSHRGRPLLLLALMLTAAYVPFPEVEAQSPASSVPAQVAEVTAVSGNAGDAGCGVGTGKTCASVNFTWQLAPQDTNQITGAYQYNLTFNFTCGQCGAPTAPATPTTFANVAKLPVANRPGWVFASVSFLFYPQWGNATFYWTAWQGTGQLQSVASCQTSLHLATNWSHAQCAANPIDPPRGISAKVLTPFGTNTPSQINITLQTSEDDVVAGDPFTYWLYQGSNPNSLFNLNNSFAPPADGQAVTFTSWGTYRSATVNVFAAPNSTAAHHYAAIAYDPATHMRSGLSCQIGVTQGLVNSASACGNVSVPRPPSFRNVTGPSYPLANLTYFAEILGIDLTIFSYAFAFVTIAALTGAGFWISGPVLAIAGGAAGTGLSWTLNLIPDWLLIAIYALLATYVVFWAVGYANGRTGE